eukprot:CFRG6482T1
MERLITTKRWQGQPLELCLARDALTTKQITTFDKIVEMEARCFPPDEQGSANSISLRLEKAGEFFATLHDGKKMIGFINSTRCDEFVEETMTSHMPTGPILAIHSVVVDHPYRRQGLASAMLTAYIEQIAKIHKDISEIALIAKAYLVGYYVSCGFTCKGISPIEHGSDEWFDLTLNLAEYRRLRYVIVDAFIPKSSVKATDSLGSGYKCTGNPAGVVCLPKGTEVSDAWMQGVAGEINLSETAFLVPHTDTPCNEWNLRWFTPTTEIPLCGHGTLASAHHLWEISQADSTIPLYFHTKYSGILVAEAEHNRNSNTLSITLNFPLDHVTPLSTITDDYRELVTRAISLTNWEKDNGKSPIIDIQNSRYQIAEVIPEAFESVVPNNDAMSKLKESGQSGLIVTCKGDSRKLTTGDTAHFSSRYFSLRVGVLEDPVTGAAHCMLGAYWRKRLALTPAPTALSKTNGKKEDMVCMLAYQNSTRGGELTLHLSPNQSESERVYLSGFAKTRMDGWIL